MSKKPLLSVIVPAYNAGHTLGRCLEAIRGQEGIDPDDMELILVDDGSTDKSAERVKEKCDKFIRLAENRGAAAARNAGANAADAEILVFVDSDVLLEPGALSAFVRLFRERPELAAAVGRYTELPAAPGPVNLYHNLYTRFHHDLCPREIDWFWGALSAVRKVAFMEARGFDERYRGASAEDMEFGLALSRAGRKIAYCPEAEGAHAHDFTLKEMLKNDYKKALLGTRLLLLGRLPRKAPGFAGPGNIAFMILIVSAPLLLLAGAAGALFYLLAAAALGVAFLFGSSFGKYLSRHFQGLGKLVAFGLYWLQSFAIFAGAAAGAAGLLFGRGVYGRPGWI